MKHASAVLQLGLIALVSGVSSQVRAQTAAAPQSTVPTKAHAGGAQTPSANQAKGKGGQARLEEVVVTAQRRSERLQDVPIAVTALSGQQLADRGLTSTMSLAGEVPNLNLISSGPDALNPFIRGVGELSGGISDEPSVATYIDGVYIASSTSALVQSFNDVQQIEVLKGPQGTLFGRNSTGGVIQVTTRDPTQTPTLDTSISYGNYNSAIANVYASTGWAPWAASNLAFFYDYQGDGYGTNFATGSGNNVHRNYGFRTKTVLTPTSSTEIRISADYAHSFAYSNFQLAPGVVAADGAGFLGAYNSNNDHNMYSRNEQYGFSMQVNQDFGFARFTSITAYRHDNLFFTFDEDLTPLPILPINATEFQHNISQEFQILSPKTSNIDWMLGAFYFDTTAGQNPFQIGGLAAAPAPFINIIDAEHTVSKSVFGQSTMPLFAGLKLTTGLRYTQERQSLQDAALANQPSSQFDKFTWRLALDYEFSRNLDTYVSWNRGIKSGGFSLVAPGAPGYLPEQLDAYEVGLKSEFFNRRVRFNIAGFYYDYSNIQVSIAEAGTVVIVNAGKARMYGTDADLQFAATDNLTFSGGLGLLSAKYLDYANATTFGMQANEPVVIPNARGADTPLAPPVNANANAIYEVPLRTGSLTFTGAVIYNGQSWADPANRLAYPAYTLVNGTAGWTSDDGRLGIQIWVRNLTDARYYSDRFASAFGDIQYQAPPRTFGFTLRSKF